MHNQVRFCQVKNGQSFNFTEDTEQWIGQCIKIDRNHYALWDNRYIIVCLHNLDKMCSIQYAQ